MLNSLWVALSTYSRIPVPRTEWTEQNMAYSMAFLPVIGGVMGAVLYGWFLLANRLGVGSFFFGAVSTALVLIITGGIHVDGLCDTADALCSHRERERKLEILKDPHIGAFGVIACCTYLIGLTACFSELYTTTAPFLFAGVFVVSRSVSGYLTQILPNARGNGMLMTFTKSSDRRKVANLLTCWMLFGILMLLLTQWAMGLCMIGAEILLLAWFLRMTEKEFGGITGDLIGCFLQLSELVMLMGMIVGACLWNCI